MIDPEVLYGKLASGSASAVAAAGDPLTGASSALSRAGDAVRSGGSTATSAWRGTSATGFGKRADLSARAAGVARERLGTGVEVIRAAAEAYSQMRVGADQVIAQWRARSPLMTPAEMLNLAGQVNQALDGVKNGYEKVLREYASALKKVKPGFGEVASGDAGWGAAVAAVRSPQVPAPGSDPKQVAAWWKGLSQEQRDELLRTRFQELGQLRGLPSEVLDQANRSRIADDAQRFGAERDRLDTAMEQRARELGIDPSTSDGLTRLLNDPEYARMMDERRVAAQKADNAAAVQESLTKAEDLAKKNGWFNEQGKADVRVLAWDPYGPRGDGATAFAYGNPDTAKNLAVAVPGTGSTLDGFSVEQAGNLRQAMGADGNATIQWLGYDAPGWAIGEVDNPAQAREGGLNLVADVDGYRAAAEAAGNKQHLTVIGHSYGSTTVGHAGMNGLKADDIAFVGSPGVGASNANQLSVGPGHVYAGATEHDPVVQGTSSTWFTEDGSSTGPYDKGFGATIFGTSDSKNLVGAHTQYYDQGSESIQNLARIANGDGGSVTSQKWHDNPLGPSLPGSDLPVVGPVVDAVGNTAVGAADLVIDAGSGLWDAGSAAVDGRWGDAGRGVLDTAGEVLNDAGDIVVNGVGDAVELGKDVWDNTLGALF
ncbi:hypothetical protein KCV87_21665 [Actinosynnema pretiosum subsp. pretiosum]|uniref:DUF1023 domain-containing protein n=1 Tax=Actinosynnema pretiosum subsp. pretiosum TaxID=103721 RepID=A0AA45L2G1_9PSEU|nr:protein of unknown function DUF1023 [Actinosynnema pretiosum subsp. pretiosum]QUF02112.1 hypothetical protein KCV87_21665 [Actinosynnema pretiosum subsp. pretiosum]